VGVSITDKDSCWKRTLLVLFEGPEALDQAKLDSRAYRTSSDSFSVNLGFNIPTSRKSLIYGNSLDE
jgi:hypothetical protein